MRLLGISYFLVREKAQEFRKVRMGCWGEGQVASNRNWITSTREHKTFLYGTENNAQRNRWIPLLHESRTKEVERSILPGI